jgi:Domain of unknown function (DUF4404)
VSASLHRQLEALRQELANSHSVDTESRALIASLIADINRLLQREAAAPEPESLVERLDSAAIRFESDHPALGTGLRQLIDTLGKAGI